MGKKDEPRLEVGAKFGRYTVTKEDVDTWRSINSPRMGSWSFSSETDPRWNCDGRGRGFVSSGFAGAEGAQEKLDELKKSLGDPPKDLMYSFFKD